MAEETKDEPIIDVTEAYSKTEQFVVDNQKSLSIIVAAIVLMVGGFLAWKYWWVASQEKEAQKELYLAETYFAKDSLAKAIDGDGIAMGLVKVADEYGVTPSGNLAEFYLGVAYMKKGEFEKAIDHLKDFNSSDQMIGPIALGDIGDCYVELGKVDEGISYYLKAVSKNKNKFTSPLFLKKAGIAYESQKDYKNAVKVYERIKADYDKSSEGKEIDKYLARAKALAGE